MMLALTTIEWSLVAGQLFTIVMILIGVIFSFNNKQIKELKLILKGVLDNERKQIEINTRMAGFWEAWKDDRKQIRDDKKVSQKNQELYLKSIGEQSLRMDRMAERTQTIEQRVNDKIKDMDDSLGRVNKLYESNI